MSRALHLTVDAGAHSMAEAVREAARVSPLAGWIGGHHAELEDAFGAVARAGTDGQPPGERG